jgi:hypothetical protein
MQTPQRLPRGRTTDAGSLNGILLSNATAGRIPPGENTALYSPIGLFNCAHNLRLRDRLFLRRYGD